MLRIGLALSLLLAAKLDAAVSVPAKMSAVPLLVGMDVSDPKIRTQHLREGAFRLLVKKRERNAKVPKGRIISQEPVAGSVLKSQSTISVIVSDGR